MIWLYISIPLVCLFIGLAGGYALGYFHSLLLDKIRTLTEQVNKPVEEPLEEPATPAVMGGAYQPPTPPAATNIVADKRRSAGLVDTKTPELMDWEAKQALEALGKQG